MQGVHVFCAFAADQPSIRQLHLGLALLYFLGLEMQQQKMRYCMTLL